MDRYPQIDLDVVHHFSYGTYVRELHIPAGTMLTGKIHRFPCTNIISNGRLKVVTDEVDEFIEAPATFESGGGVKKAIYAIDDSILLTVHPWNGEDTLEELEDKLIADSYESLDGAE